MKTLMKLIVFGGLLLLLLGVAAWKIPSSLILDRMDWSVNGMSYARATGTMWQGGAEQFKYRDLMLGDLQWDFQTINRLRPVVTTWKVNGKGLDYELSALVDMEGTQARDLRFVQGFIPAGWVDLSKVTPLVFLTGRFDIDLDHASPSGNTAKLAAGTIRWNEAGLSGLVEESLGTVIIELSSDNRFTVASIRSDPAAEIRIDGQVKFNASQYQTELVVQAVEEKQYVLEQLSELGTVREDGALEVNLSGRHAR